MGVCLVVPSVGVFKVCSFVWIVVCRLRLFSVVTVGCDLNWFVLLLIELLGLILG